jgi:hypothetical protein
MKLLLESRLKAKFQYEIKSEFYVEQDRKKNVWG